MILANKDNVHELLQHTIDLLIDAQLKQGVYIQSMELGKSSIDGNLTKLTIKIDLIGNI